MADLFGAGFPVAWGTGSLGITNPPPSLTNVVAIAAGPYHNLAVLDNGRVAGWGDDTYGKATSPLGLTGVVAVAGGGNHSLALRNNGRVVAWGDPTTTNVPPGLNDVMRIAAGDFHSLALRSNGTVVAWGASNQTPPAGLSGVIAIAAGGNQSLALRANGSVVAWGQAPAPPPLSGVIAIAAGSDFCLALRNSGTIVGWGNAANNRTLPPPHSAVVAIAAGAAHGVALRSDQTVFAWGDNSLNQTVVPNGTSNVIAVAAGSTHSLALRMHPPRFTAHPTPRSVVQDGSTTFTATFTGSAPISLQWRLNGTPIPNATNLTYTISGVQSNHAGNYTLLLSNLVGTAVSTNALLTVNVPAFIAQAPQNQRVGEGSTATFTVVPGGTLPIGYRWQKNGTNIPNATSSTYSIMNVTTNHAGNYRVIVSNAFGMATSVVATLTVDPLPVITTHPQSQTVFVGETATFSVSAQNATGYQWRKGTNNILGATQPVYTINNVQTSDATNYSVRVSNQYGAVNSQVAVLTVATPVPRLRMETPRRLPNGNVRLRIANQDGSAIDPARASKVEVYATSDITSPIAQWTKRNITFTLVNGALQGEDVTPLPNRRFYVALEKP